MSVDGGENDSSVLRMELGRKQVVPMELLVLRVCRNGAPLALNEVFEF